MTELTPTEKAKELVEKFFYGIHPEWGKKDIRFSIFYGFAKDAAITHVEEMINFCNRSPLLNKGKDTDEVWSFYIQVKSEIENL